MTTISPVTESEMNEFFSKIVSSFVGLSQQAAELVEVRRAVETIEAKLATIVTENERLREDNGKLQERINTLGQEVSDAWSNNRSISAERDEFRRIAESNQVAWESAVKQAEDEARRRQDLEMRLVEAQETIRHKEQEYTALRQEHTEQTNELRVTGENRDWWKTQHSDSTNAYNALAERYAGVKTKLDEIRASFT